MKEDAANWKSRSLAATKCVPIGIGEQGGIRWKKTEQWEMEETRETPISGRSKSTGKQGHARAPII